MTVESVVVMVLVLGGVWGSFLFLLLRAARSDRAAGPGDITPDPGPPAGREGGPGGGSGPSA